MIRLVFAVLLGYYLLQPALLFAHGAQPTLEQPLATQEIRYQMPEAGEVFFVWGINKWKLLPEEQRPAGTIVKDDVMYTPMARDGDVFVVRIQVPVGTTIDYVFQITKTSAGTATDLWDKNGASNKDFHTVVQQSGMVKVQSTLAAAAPQPPQEEAKDALVTKEIRYYVPDAGEVFLVWGINGWTTVPEDQRPAGTVIKDGIMYTPMQRDGNSFRTSLQVPGGGTIECVFQITKTTQGEAVEIWDTQGDSGKEYRTFSSQPGLVEIHASSLVEKQKATSNSLNVTTLWWGLLGLIVVTAAIAGRRRLAPQSAGSSDTAPESIFTTITSYLPQLRPLARVSGRLAIVPILIVLALAAILRLNHIKQPFVDAFSWRETSVAMMADNFYRTNWNIFFPEVNWSGPGPGYQGREFQTVSYISAILYLVVGQHDWVARAVAIVFGLWGIFALYQLVRRVWDEQHALAAAAVMAVLPGSIIIERSFLPDPAMVALVVTSCWMLTAYLQTERRRYLLLAGIIGAWGFCTKIPGLIVGLPMAYAALTILGKRILSRNQLAALSGFAILTLTPVIGYYLWARHLALSYPPYHFAGDGNWLWQDGLQRWLDQKYFLPQLIRHFTGWFWTVPVIALVALGLISQPPSCTDAANETRGKTPWFFHCWFLAGVIFYSFGAQELVSNPWNFHIINPAAAALAGHAILLLMSLTRRLTRLPVAFVPLIVALAVIGWYGHTGLKDWYKPYSNESLQMGLELRKLTQPGDLVVTLGNDFGDPVAIYYSRRRGWGFPPASPDYAWDRLPEDDTESIQHLENLRVKGAGWMGIVREHLKDVREKHSRFAAYIEQTCELEAETEDYVIYRILTPQEIGRLSTKP